MSDTPETDAAKIGIHEMMDISVLTTTLDTLCRKIERDCNRLLRDLADTKRQLADETSMREQAWIDKGIAALQDQLGSAKATIVEKDAEIARLKSIIKDALQGFSVTQDRTIYAHDHWSNRAARIQQGKEKT